MGEPVADSKVPVLVAVGCIIAGLVIAAAGGGVLHGSILGAIVCAAGAIPSCFGMWKGVQQSTQTTLALSVVCVLASLGVGLVLLVLALIHMFV